MKKYNLINGDVVYLRNGGFYMFMEDKINNTPHDLIGLTGGFMSTSDYDNDFKIKSKNREWDIVKVYRLNYFWNIFATEEFDIPKVSKLMYEEKEVKKMTLAQISEELGYEVELIEEDK